jgi:hypothetical protein
MHRHIKRLLIWIWILVGIYTLILLFPWFFFTYKVEYGQFIIYSDRQIDKNISTVLKDVQSRILKSEWYSQSDIYHVFICNTSWRLAIFTRSSTIGGRVNTIISDNVYIRESDISRNSILSPVRWQDILTPLERPLSYFIAHEIIHIYQWRNIGRLKLFTLPMYIQEWYPDYIAKKPNFNFTKYAQDYLKESASMSPENWLYNRYHLLIAYLIDIQGKNYQQIIEENIPINILEQQLSGYIKKYK